jgi:hypothetical protein
MMVAMELTTLLWWRCADDDHQNEGCGIIMATFSLAPPHVAPHSCTALIDRGAGKRRPGAGQ